MAQGTRPSVQIQILRVYTQLSYAFDDLDSLISIPCYTHAYTYVNENSHSLHTILALEAVRFEVSLEAS